MKRLLSALAIALVLAGIALSAFADPIEVGGNFTSSASTSGKRAPFQTPEVVVLCTPIEVGGN